MVVFAEVSSSALEKEEESPSFDDSDDSLTDKLSIDDYIIGENSDDFYESLLSLGSTALERILNYSSFDLSTLLGDLDDDEVEYHFDSDSTDIYSDDDYQISEGFTTSTQTQQDLISYFIEKMLDYINPSTGIDEVNDCRDDGDDVIRRARRWQFEVNFNVVGSEISLYREACEALDASGGYRKFTVLRA